MMEFFRRIFRFIFGGNETKPIDEAPVSQPAETTIQQEPQPEPRAKLPAETENEPDLPGDFTTGGVDIRLVRFDFGKADTLGKLYINGKFQCYTLENSEAGKHLLPTGSHSLSLNTSGGRHATYLFRFRDLHKGMLAITGVTGFDSACIHIGNRVEDNSGSVMVGNKIFRQTESDFREVWYSDKAYMKIYPAIAEVLVKGGQVSINIS
ncbi:MAG: DUF5675 family protein [Bacteroidia bacterium]